MKRSVFSLAIGLAAIAAALAVRHLPTTEETADQQTLESLREHGAI